MIRALFWLAGSQAVHIRERGVKQVNQIVFKHGLYFGTLLVLPVCGFQHGPHFILRNVLGQRQLVVEAVVGQLDRVLLINLGPPQAVVSVAMHRHDVHRRAAHRPVPGKHSYMRF